ncbi:RulB domain protein [Pseudomonas savastanoi pv. phaseolicola 1448A]|uniref:RulB domain protein n=1 Tax=Pseudomonas savastanoi pv. phaseolicola (strain 1448A / Race 6) TaxID=264730 RepID=Q48KF2_PSE14|nr:RulB domain protein [Pseudomonas savastanoi pv. phaseolicola 1448A]
MGFECVRETVKPMFLLIFILYAILVTPQAVVELLSLHIRQLGEFMGDLFMASQPVAAERLTWGTGSVQYALGKEDAKEGKRVTHPDFAMRRQMMSQSYQKARSAPDAQMLLKRKYDQNL